MDFRNIRFTIPKTKYTKHLGISGKKARVVDIWANGKFMVLVGKSTFPIYEVPENVKRVVFDAISSEREKQQSAKIGTIRGT
jgi:hypothetical protein